MTEPDFIPPIDGLPEHGLGPVAARSDAHLAALKKYRLELAQGFRCISAVSNHLAIISETGDPHSVFDQQVEVLSTLIRQVDNSLTCLRNLADSKGTA